MKLNRRLHSMVNVLNIKYAILDCLRMFAYVVLVSHIVSPINDFYKGNVPVDIR